MIYQHFNFQHLIVKNYLYYPKFINKFFDIIQDLNHLIHQNFKIFIIIN